MAYNRVVWETGDVMTKEKMNRSEEQLAILTADDEIFREALLTYRTYTSDDHGSATLTWSNSDIKTSNGGTLSDDTNTHISTNWSNGAVPKFIKVANGYKVKIGLRSGDDSSSFQGILQADGTLEKSSTDIDSSIDYYHTGIISLAHLTVTNTWDIRFVLMNIQDNTTISPTEGTNLLICEAIDFQGEIDEVKNQLSFDQDQKNLILLGNINVNNALGGNGDAVYTVSASSESNTSDFIPVTEGEILIARGFRRFSFTARAEQGNTDNNGKGSDNCNPASTTLPELIPGTGIRYIYVPTGANYFRCTWKKDRTEDGSLFLYKQHVLSDNLYGQGLNYIALGSSTTKGTYSTIGNMTSSGADATYSYARYIANINGYKLTNYGVGGMGWHNRGSQDAYGVAVNKNAAELVHMHYDPTAATPVNDFANADIISLAFGTNDFKGQWGASDTDASDGWVLGDISSPAYDPALDVSGYTYTVIGAMKYVIETLYAAAPKAQIIVILPENFRKLGVKNDGDNLNEEIEIVTSAGVDYSCAKQSNNWAFGTHNIKGDTLEDYRVAMKECAEYYGLKVVDMQEVCSINRMNLLSLLGDGIHPTIEYYKAMGYQLAPYIK